ncbi:PH domain-containing protein [Piscibacillus halophilus]|uniref:PH domain-containing protein n=1 Tax=Piscibacillus halophilus TaxID=571933 RepID=A0A1H8YTT7_9BACI|nr:PH domain-containing protein [Piscibacillus halophilus]SEP55634.1 PH domain-containing protein [Piscibacillus halophilus]
MVFRSKKDRYVNRLIVLSIILIGVSTLFPLFLDGINLTGTVVLMSIFLVTSVFILWVYYGVKYVFYDEYLYVKGGPFRSKIHYKDITQVAPTDDILTGYRILSSRDAIEIFYRTAILGSVKISPQNKDEFIDELIKRCPNIKVKT